MVAKKNTEKPEAKKDDSKPAAPDVAPDVKAVLDRRAQQATEKKADTTPAAPAPAAEVKADDKPKADTTPAPEAKAEKADKAVKADKAAAARQQELLDVKGKADVKPDRASALSFDPNDIVIIGLDTPHKEGEHHLWDERILLPLDKHMVANVKAFGVKENIIVVRDPKLGYLAVDGRQRIRWAREASKALEAEGQAPLRILANLEKGDVDTQAGVMILTNEIRQSDDFLTKAKKAQRLMSERGYNLSRTALTFGVSVPSLKNWLKLLETSDVVQKAVEDGVITASAALNLRELSEDKQAQAIDALRDAAKDGQRLTGKDVAKKAIQILDGDDDSDNDDDDSDDEGDEDEKPKASKDTAKKARDAAQKGDAPKRAQVRKALKQAIESKGRINRLAGALLSWVLGDNDQKKQEMEDLNEDDTKILREIFDAGKVRKSIKIVAKK